MIRTGNNFHVTKEEKTLHSKRDRRNKKESASERGLEASQEERSLRSRRGRNMKGKEPDQEKIKDTVISEELDLVDNLADMPDKKASRRGRGLRGKIVRQEKSENAVVSEEPDLVDDLMDDLVNVPDKKTGRRQRVSAKEKNEDTLKEPKKRQKVIKPAKMGKPAVKEKKIKPFGGTIAKSKRGSLKKQQSIPSKDITADDVLAPLQVSETMIAEKLKNCMLDYTVKTDLSYAKFLAEMIEDDDSEPIVELNSINSYNGIASVVNSINDVLHSNVMPSDFVEPIANNLTVSNTVEVEIL